MPALQNLGSFGNCDGEPSADSQGLYRPPPAARKRPGLRVVEWAQSQKRVAIKPPKQPPAAVSGKLPLRNTSGALGTHRRRSGESPAVAKVLVHQGVQSPAGMTGAERPKHRRGGSLRRRPSLAQSGHSERLLQRSFLAGRRSTRKGSRRRSPRPQGPSGTALWVRHVLFVKARSEISPEFDVHNCSDGTTGHCRHGDIPHQ